MAQTKAIVDKLLTQASSAYIPQGYVSEMILPPIFVKQKSGKLAKYGTSHLRIEATLGGGRGAYRRVESITRSTSTYLVDSHGLEEVLSPDDYDNVEAPYDAERDAVTGLTTLLWLKKEKSLADQLTSTSNLTQNTTLSGTSQFSDHLNSDPINVFATGRKAVVDGCGIAPDTAIMDWVVYNQLRYHPQMLDALGFKQARPGGLKAEELAVALDVKRVLIAQARYESAAEGQSSSLAAVWGKHIVLGVCPDAAQPYQTSLGYRIQLSRHEPRRVYKYPVYNPPESTGIIVQDHWDMLLSNVNAAYLIKDAVA